MMLVSKANPPRGVSKMTGTLSHNVAAQTTENDPVLDRAAFFFDLELLELTSTIPPAGPKGIAKY